MQQIEIRLREVVAHVTGLGLDISSDSDLYLDLGVPSVHALQLLSELELRFGVAIPDEEFVQASSIRDLTMLMTRLVRSKENAGHD